MIYELSVVTVASHYSHFQISFHISYVIGCIYINSNETNGVINSKPLPITAELARASRKTIRRGARVGHQERGDKKP